MTRYFSIHEGLLVLFAFAGFACTRAAANDGDLATQDFNAEIGDPVEHWHVDADAILEAVNSKRRSIYRCA
jgi:hypothetical protein